MWLVSVGSTIPIFARSKQNRLVAESEARVVANRREVEALEQVVRLRAAQRRTALAAALETVRLYRDGLLVQSEATADSTLAQYEVGRLTFASVLEANAGLVADREGYLQAIAQARRLAIDAAEVSLSPISPSGGGMAPSTMPGAGAAASGGPSSTSSM